MKKLLGKRGFTLIEIVIVIVLLAILAAVAYPKYLDLRDDAHKSADQAVIGSWRAGVHIYFGKNKEFPSAIDTLKGCLDGGVPDGWEVEAGTASGTFNITCDGLPSDRTKIQSWTYDSVDGSFTLVPDGHGF